MTTKEQARLKMLARIERLSLDCEMSKAQVRKLTNAARSTFAITATEHGDILAILADRDQCAEDAMNELFSSVI